MALASVTFSPSPCPPVTIARVSGLFVKYSNAQSSLAASVADGTSPRTAAPSTITASAPGSGFCALYPATFAATMPKLIAKAAYPPISSHRMIFPAWVAKNALTGFQNRPISSSGRPMMAGRYTPRLGLLIVWTRMVSNVNRVPNAIKIHRISTPSPFPLYTS